MPKTVTVMGQTAELTFQQSQKEYVTVQLRPAPLRAVSAQGNVGTYVEFIRVESSTNDLGRARADLRHHGEGPGTSSFIVRVEDSAVIF